MEYAKSLEIPAFDEGFPTRIAPQLDTETRL
ncbi:hypothetical protein IAW_05932 [Bacillus cereus str. Schrouff]|nr:hypothetical protein IAW_05932 [Bacillus cereus str. Schrouff]EOO80752.1 hypothetical protein IGY_06118 [Bacillus cereus K-5975c]